MNDDGVCRAPLASAGSAKYRSMRRTIVWLVVTSLSRLSTVPPRLCMAPWQFTLDGLSLTLCHSSQVILPGGNSTGMNPFVRGWPQVGSGHFEVWYDDTIEEEKSSIRETLNLSACAVSSTNTIRIQKKNYLKCVTCHVSLVTCHVSLVTCHLFPVTCPLSQVFVKQISREEKNMTLYIKYHI